MSHCDELRLARCRAVSSPAGCRRSLRLGLRRYYSTDEEAAQLAATLRVPLDTKLGSGLASASRLRKTIPGAVSWPEAHPYPVIGALILPMLAIVSLIVWVLNDFK